MKKSGLMLWLLILTGSAWAQETEKKPPPDITAYLNPSNPHKGMSETVHQILTEAGKTLGFRGGKAQRAWELQGALRDKENILNTLYDFRTLISPQGWLPPVVVSAQDIAHITDDHIRSASRIYHILSPERFVSHPPSWRPYLMAGLSTTNTALPDNAVRPKNGEQRTVWRKAIEKGWSEGRESADRILEANFHRLTRDYTGMLQYSTLLQQGMVTPPRVTEQQQTVVGTPAQLILGDKIKRLKQRAQFNIDHLDWQPIITTEKKSNDGQ
ncbi:conjugal transfer protein [Candidatus Williamhamiltonella defendens]|uniref:Conjugal transfer protein n=1 Tax=Candidatus Williamhamiltonella defendens TaxID=138072 RepID=A0AAC9VJA8_9ENTR|nr:type IV secretion system DotC family protein [Candidatus Hamiltonella defensa]ASV33918.1 conjugal transfer protein [Candidatus Hamiltonella defensa]